jgi:hypothetical protein
VDDYAIRLRGHQLAELQWHWGEAYEVTWDSAHYVATRRDDGTALKAATPRELWDLIRDDYSARPVPRDTWQPPAP